MTETPTVDPHLQLYSEVLALRKELIVVKEDEDRLRNQLNNAEQLKAGLKPEVAVQLNDLEEDATHSAFDFIWEKQMEEQSPDRMEWSTIDLSDLYKRSKAARKMFHKAVHKSESLLHKKEKNISKAQGSAEETKKSLKNAFDEEMENLKEARLMLRAVEMEERYHFKRGTGRGRIAAVDADKIQKAKEINLLDMENKTIVKLSKLQQENQDLKEAIKKMENEKAETERITEEKAKELERSVNLVESDGEEAREILEKLKEESNRIASIREDMHRIMLYVRAQNKVA